jgi:hypothetical protein
MSDVQKCLLVVVTNETRLTFICSFGASETLSPAYCLGALDSERTRLSTRLTHSCYCDPVTSEFPMDMQLRGVLFVNPPVHFLWTCNYGVYFL